MPREKSDMEFEVNPLRRAIYCCLSICLVANSNADQPTAVQIGVASEKPADGVSVQAGDFFMVPYTETIPGTDITFEMVPVPAGSYMMGSAEDEDDRNDNDSGCGPAVYEMAQRDQRKAISFAHRSRMGIRMPRRIDRGLFVG
jgi:hypothetical protein